MGDLRVHFRPEFLNRLDEIIMFKPLTKTNVRSIIDLLVADVNRRLEERELSVELTDAAKDFVVEGGYEPMYGARPLKRYLQKNVETLAAKTVGYKDIAESIGNPRACRAVGNANNKNKLWIVVPCHRVINSDGSIGGYGGAVWRKEYLLKLEKDNS